MGNGLARLRASNYQLGSNILRELRFLPYLIACAVVVQASKGRSKFVEEILISRCCRFFLSLFPCVPGF